MVLRTELGVTTRGGEGMKQIITGATLGQKGNSMVVCGIREGPSGRSEELS